MQRNSDVENKQADNVNVGSDRPSEENPQSIAPLPSCDVSSAPVSLAAPQAEIHPTLNALLTSSTQVKTDESRQVEVRKRRRSLARKDTPPYKRRAAQAPTFQINSRVAKYGLNPGPVAGDTVPQSSQGACAEEATRLGYDDEGDDEDDMMSAAQQSPPPPDLCPICQQPMSSSFMASYGAVDLINMKIRQQSKFCLAHKRHEADETWAERNYPTIEWKMLEDRLKKLDPMLEELLNGRISNPFREELEEQVKKGKHRALVQDIGADSEVCLTPGYYGSKGSQIM